MSNILAPPRGCLDATTAATHTYVCQEEEATVKREEGRGDGLAMQLLVIDSYTVRETRLDRVSKPTTIATINNLVIEVERYNSIV